MFIGDTFKNDLLKLIFQGTTITSIAINATASPFTVYYLALHTANPGTAGSQNTSEVSYTDYARVPVTRDASGWNIAANIVTPVDPITFPAVAGAAGQIATHASLGTASSGAGKILFAGAISPTISCDLGSEPSLNTDSTITLTEC